MKFDLGGKNAVVTGGNSGIGKAIAEALKGQGAEVFILDLDESKFQLKNGINTITTDISKIDELNFTEENI